MQNNLAVLRQFVWNNRWRLLPIWVLIGLIIIFLLSGFLALLPPGPSYLLPMQRAYDFLGTITLRLTSVICLGVLPVALIGIVWAVRRFNKEAIWQDDIVIAYWLATMLFMVSVFIIPLVISTAILPDFIFPGHLTDREAADERDHDRDDG